GRSGRAIFKPSDLFLEWMKALSSNCLKANESSRYLLHLSEESFNLCGKGLSVLIVSELLESPSVREHEANIRKAFYPESFRDVRVLVRVHSDKYAALKKRSHMFIFECGLFHSLTRSAPLGEEIEDDRLIFFLALRESFIKERKSAREGQRHRFGCRPSLSAYHSRRVTGLFDHGDESCRLDLRRVIRHHEFVPVHPHFYLLNPPTPFQHPL